MFKKILVPTDGSPLAEKAVAGAIEYARSAGATLVGLAVAEPFPSFLISEAGAVAAASLVEFVEASAHEALKHFETQVSAAGIPFKAVELTDPNPWSAIVETATREGCDAIFMASHGRRGVDALLLGSQTQRVLVHSKLPVLVYR